ncbi:MAG: tetratricopeptide repeat protein [Kiritimatiellae bacterium]|nr:tetratricopeptide repeat protein [Kiritimatiellia bacterium]
MGVYCFTLFPGPFPGESAKLIVQHLGLDPFTPLSHPVWGILVKCISNIPIFSVAHAINLFSAACAAGSIWLVFSIVSQIQHTRTLEEVRLDFSEEKSQLISGVVAALYLLVSVPFWVVGTRAHTLSFDTLFLLVVVYLLLRAYRTKRVSLLYIIVFLCGLGATEFATFIILAPFFATAILVYLWTNNLLQIKKFVGLSICYILGLSFCFYAAYNFYQSDTFAWGSFSSFFQVLRIFWRDQYYAVTTSVPHIGWLLVGVSTIIPWLFVIPLIRKKDPTDTKSVWGSYMLHGVLTILAVWLLLDTYFEHKFSPWGLFGWSSLLITPYVFVAMWAGYLAGYWYVVFFGRVRQNDQRNRPLLEMIKRVFRLALFPALIGIFIVALFLNGRVVYGKSGRYLDVVAQEVVKNLEGRLWLISNGVLDNLILLKAHERDQALNILNPAKGRSSAYLNYVSSLFGGNNRLKGLAKIGLVPLLNEWISSSSGIQTNLAVLSVTDIWTANAYHAIPQTVLFSGVDDKKKIDPDLLMKQHRTFWEHCQRMKSGEIFEKNIGKPVDTFLSRHLSKVANNLGVFFEDMGRTNLAFEAYTQARKFDEKNVSTLLNQASLSTRISHPEEEALQAELEIFLRKLRGKYQIWSLSYHYGYVRNAQAYAQTGLAWALSGRPKVAIEQIKRAIEVGKGSESFQLTLASLYLSTAEDESSEKIYLSLLKKNPNHTSALFGLFRLSMRKTDFDSARAYLGRLKELGMSTTALQFNEALLESLLGNYIEAKTIFENIVKREPQNLNAWTALAVVASEMGDEKIVDTALEKVATANSSNAGILLALAELQSKRKKPKEARGLLDKILKVQPNHLRTLDMLLRLDVYEARRDSAEKHIEEILSIDFRHAFANYVLGTLQVTRGELALAEASFRTSLEKDRAFHTLNDLAWVLQKRQAYDKGLKLAEESLALNNKSAVVWDTYGVILFKKNKLKEAEDAILKALELAPNYPLFSLHIAQVYERKGLTQKALELVDLILARPAALGPESYDEAQALRLRLKK